jgi:glycosyltransferase involved in cell wall biosynthesis
MLIWIKRIHRWVFLSDQPDFRAFYDHWLARRIQHPGIVVIPNGVEPLDRYASPQSFRKLLGIPRSSIFFLCVANYCLRKDQGFAARAFRQAAIPGSTLVFIGSEFNESSAVFRNADAAWALPDTPGKIIWLEKKDRETTLAALADCDIFVLSSNHEAQPIALLEAMRESKPWIARDAGCISEMPGGVCVFSEKQMALEMRRLAQNTSARSAFGNIGLSAIKSRFSRISYANSYSNLIQQLTFDNSTK